MSEILFLAHRLPFPPDKGDKIRSYHLLRHFAAERAVHLGCFYDDPDDGRHVAELQRLCASVEALRLRSGLARLKSARGFLTGQALSIPYYFDAAMAAWVSGVLRERRIGTIIAYSSPMGQYALGRGFDAYRRIMDFVDVDSDKWRQYAERTGAPMSWVYAREARRLADFERRVAREFDASVFVTEDEVSLFDTIAPASRAKHHAIGNGVATSYFDPGGDYRNPFTAETLPLVFTGMMDYWANVDAVNWFAHEVFPAIRAREPRARLWIVGAAPTDEVQALSGATGVTVTGRVRDVRPYLRYAAIAIAPLRIARGIQNKVLEALAMGCRVLCSPQAAAGIRVAGVVPVTVAASAQEMADAACSLLGAAPRPDDRERARQFVIDHFGWEKNLERFSQLETALPAKVAAGMGSKSVS